MLKTNEDWQSLEQIKNKLRDGGCQALANYVYKMQLKLESDIIKKKFDERRARETTVKPR